MDEKSEKNALKFGQDLLKLFERLDQLCRPALRGAWVNKIKPHQRQIVMAFHEKWQGHVGLREDETMGLNIEVDGVRGKFYLPYGLWYSRKWLTIFNLYKKEWFRIASNVSIEEFNAWLEDKLWYWTTTSSKGVRKTFVDLLRYYFFHLGRGVPIDVIRDQDQSSHYRPLHSFHFSDFQQKWNSIKSANHRLQMFLPQLSLWGVSLLLASPKLLSDERYADNCVESIPVLYVGNPESPSCIGHQLFSNQIRKGNLLFDHLVNDVTYTVNFNHFEQLDHERGFYGWSVPNLWDSFHKLKSQGWVTLDPREKVGGELLAPSYQLNLPCHRPYTPPPKPLDALGELIENNKDVLCSLFQTERRLLDKFILPKYKDQRTVQLIPHFKARYLPMNMTPVERWIIYFEGKKGLSTTRYIQRVQDFCAAVFPTTIQFPTKVGCLLRLEIPSNKESNIWIQQLKELLSYLKFDSYSFGPSVISGSWSIVVAPSHYYSEGVWEGEYYRNPLALTIKKIKILHTFFQEEEKKFGEQRNVVKRKKRFLEELGKYY